MNDDGRIVAKRLRPGPPRGWRVNRANSSNFFVERELLNRAVSQRAATPVAAVAPAKACAATTGCGAAAVRIQASGWSIS